MKIEKSTPDKIGAYRTDYLDALPEFQELFLELMIKDSGCYLLRSRNKEIGYAIVNGDGVLVEFYIMNRYLPGSDEVFSQVLKDLSVREIYCKSFDALLLSNCLVNSLSYSVMGALYRDYVEPLVAKDPEIRMKRSGFSSVELFLGQDDSIKELFQSEAQLTGFIQNDHVFEFYANDELVGCGMVLRTMPGRDFCDLGVWVHPLKRGKSSGAQILMNLREFAVQNNMRPSCGCAIGNRASQKVIEKSGFVSRYKMIKFATKQV